MTLSVRAGTFARAEFRPVSNVILKGAETYAALNLYDVQGNPIGPDLHSIDIETEN